MTTVEESLLADAFTAAELQHMTFDPLREFVPSIVTEGLTIFAGGPKLGKSYMSLDISLACSSGGVALGHIAVEQCDVLYLALEDGGRRLQSRTRQLMADGQQWPHRLVMKTKVLPGLVAPTITQWYEHHPASLVILDTLTKNRPQRPPGADPYIADYRFGTALKEVVDASPGSALVCVHHTRKMAADDFLDTLSGTQGIAGAADCIIVLKRKRTSTDASLHVTGRDVEENELALTVENGRWRLDGDSVQAAAQKMEQRKEAQTNLSDKSADAVKFVNSRESTTPKDLAVHLGIDNKIAGNLLARLATSDHIRKNHRGNYVGTGSESGEKDETADHGPAVSPLSLHSPLTRQEAVALQMQRLGGGNRE